MDVISNVQVARCSIEEVHRCCSGIDTAISRQLDGTRVLIDRTTILALLEPFVASLLGLFGSHLESSGVGQRGLMRSVPIAREMAARASEQVNDASAAAITHHTIDHEMPTTSTRPEPHSLSTSCWVVLRWSLATTTDAVEVRHHRAAPAERPLSIEPAHAYQSIARTIMNHHMLPDEEDTVPVRWLSSRMSESEAA